MKKLRFLLAFVVVIAMLSTFAFAAECSFTLNTDEYAGEGDVVFNIIINSDTAIKGASVTAELSYDEDEWTVSSVSDEESMYDVGGMVMIMCDSYNVEVGANNFGTITFTPADPATATEKTFSAANFSLFKASTEYIKDYAEVVSVTKKATGPSTAESEVVSGTVKATDNVSGSEVDAKYFAKQLTLTGAEGKTVKGITTIFTPVYAAGSEKTVNPVTKSYDFDIAEGIAGGASLKFNVTLVGVPDDVVSVDIRSTLTVE